ncbi:MAG: response regulator [Verrucomicrobiota bacterium]
MVQQSEDSRSTAILAEDDEMIRELVSLYLDRMGYHVLEAKNGKEAIDLLADQAEDAVELIVTDLVMPEAGGAEVIRNARSTGKCDRILIISGFTDDATFLEQTIKEGSEFLKKPFTFVDFEAKVEGLRQGA